MSKACGKTENLVTSGGLVQPGFLYPRLGVCKHNNTTRTKIAATISILAFHQYDFMHVDLKNSWQCVQTGKQDARSTQCCHIELS